MFSWFHVVIFPRLAHTNTYDSAVLQKYLLRETIADRTRYCEQKWVNIYLVGFYVSHGSYLLWSPVIVFYTIPK